MLLHSDPLPKLMVSKTCVIPLDESLAVLHCMIIMRVNAFPQILKEALRMHGPAFGTAKCSPPEGITLNGYYIPGGTELSVPKIIKLMCCKYAAV